MSSEKLRVVNSISIFETENDKKLNKKYIVHEKDISKIATRAIKEDYYLVNELISPCIEVIYHSFSNLQSNSLNRGRFYYNQAYYDQNRTLVTKPNDFLERASSFFKWIKKQFKNTKLEGFEDFLVTQRTKQWVESGGVLIENYNISSKYNPKAIETEIEKVAINDR